MHLAKLLSRLLLALLLGIFGAFPASATTQEASAEAADPPAELALPPIPSELREAMMRRDLEAALGSLTELESERPEDADLWAYLRAIALEDARRAADAAEQLEGFDERFPESVWRSKARFRLAELYRALGRFAEAEAIYEAGVKHLRSPERQGELAEVYLGFADELSIRPVGVRPDAAPLDYERARVLYEKVLELEAPRALRGRAMYRAALCTEEQERFGEAAGAYRRYLALFDPEEAGETPGFGGAGAFVFEARLGLGRVLLRAGDAAAARRAFEDLARGIEAAGAGPWAELLASADAERAQAIERIGGDAAYAIASTWPADGSSRAVLGIAALERFLSRHPAHPEAPRAAFEIAQRYRALGRDEDALAAFDAFLARPVQTDEQEVREQDARLKQRALFLKAQVLQEQHRYVRAIAAFEEYARRHPTGSDWSAAQQGIVDAEYAIGAEHRARREYAEARAAWAAFLEAHPLDARASGLQYLIGELFAEQGEEVLRDAKVDDALARPLFQQAIDQWARLIAKHPRSDEASHALFRTGWLREQRLDELEGAIEAYRSCDFGAYAGQARSRLVAMTEPSLAIHTARTWRTDEAAQVEVQVRNVEELEVQVYELDLEAYFRKHLTYQHVEDLDLDLIAADLDFTLPVEGFAEYRPIRQTVELPVEGPGVWAVAVRGDDLRATTLVLRSDVDVIVKSSRREIFVYAQDMLRGEVAPGVEVLVAAPRAEGPLMHTLRTGPDGVARLTFSSEEDRDELERVDELRVLAVKDGNYASDGLSMSGLGLSTGLQPRGYVYTDRSAYRPGDVVHWRAILRDVTNGSYSFEPGQEWLVEVFDSQGRGFRAERLALSEFGTLDSSVELDAYAPTGHYSVRCSTPNGPTHSGSFQVAQYELKSIELELTAARNVYFRGETVEVEARAAFYYGEPVADSPLQVALPDGRVLELRTDDAGRASFELDTSEFTDERALAFRATLTEEQVGAETGVWLALTGFSASVSTAREVYLAGDAFDVELGCVAPDGEPLARALELLVLRREAAPDGRWAETLVESHELLTDEDRGRAVTSISLERGGQYVLRARGTDRFDNPVVAERHVFVSGDDDDVKLRLYAERSELLVGETVSLDLHDRAGAGLALVTFEGEEVLEYRVMQIAEGSNAIRFEVGDELFPNMLVSASMMRGNRFYTAASEFQVARRLVVEITPEAGVVAPGEETGLRVRTTDQLGRPVSAELSLSVVDAALFEQFPDQTPELRGYFEQGTQRVAALRTATSCGFRYQGVTRTIAQAILEEAKREEQRQAWELRRDQTVETLGLLSETAVDHRAVRQVLAGLEVQFDSEDADFDALAFNDVIGIGGGAGGRSGGRFRSKSSGPGSDPGIDPALADTALWTATLRTDAEGVAVLRFELPERSTRWRILSRGVGPGTRLGQAESSVVTRDELFAELRAPMHLTEGDRPRFVARLHNLTGSHGAAEIKLRVRFGDETRVLPAEVELGESPTVEFTFPELAGVPDVRELSLELEVTAELDGRTLTDRVARVVDVRPWGVEFAATESGLLEGPRTLWLELPERGEYRRRELELFLGSGVERLLIDAALGRAPGTRQHGAPTHADTAAELGGVCAVMRLLSESGGPSNPAYSSLRERAERLVVRLVAGQAEDGRWRWTGTRGGGHVETSCRALASLAHARELGLVVPPTSFERAVDALALAFREASQDADEEKAMLVYALAVAGREDFAAANRLHRMRDSLSPAALAYTARALAKMNRAPMARDVAQVLSERALPSEDDDTCRWPVDANLAANRGGVGMIALAALAMQEAGLASPRIEEATTALLERRPWRPATSAGLALEALCRWRGVTRPESNSALVTVRTPDGRSHQLPVTGSSNAMPIRVPLGAEVGRRVRVDIELQGRSSLHYFAALRGFSSDISEGERGRLRVETLPIQASAPRFRGRTIPTGFSILRERDEHWTNITGALPLGATAEAGVHYRLYGEEKATDREFLLLEVPLPAGTRVLEGSVRGNYASYEVRDGALQFQIGERTSRAGDLRYTLIGALPGEYRVLPAILRSAYDPAEMAFSTPADFAVLERGEASTDEYRATPDELYHLGKAGYDAGERELAWRELQELYVDWSRELRAEPLRDAARMLLFLAIERGDAPSIVRYFEVLKEKDPELVVPFEQVLAIGEAYRELEEHERALLIFRATIEQTFGADLRVADALQEQSEFLGSVEVAERLWLEYPDLPAVVESYLALADQVLAKAPLAANDEGLRRARRDRASLTLQGILSLRRFLALYADDPLAPEAGLNLVSAHLDLEDYATASLLAGQMADIYTEPDLRDAFLYTRAVAEWYSGHEDEAVALLSGIADAVYTDEIGRERFSENRDLALYILGQIYHARQDIPEASAYYERVDELFSDARAALASFRRKRIALDEVTTALPGEPVPLTLTYRNVHEAELLVYPVDLMTLYLRERDLSRITQVNLSGISPAIRRTVALGTGTDLRDVEQEVLLELPESGAYLVICRGDDLFASGLVLVSDLELEVKDDAEAGRLRVQVFEQENGAYLSDVDVRVVGSGGGDFVSGRTDLRGLFVASGVHGTPTVIARLDGDRYAFHRGERALVQVEPQQEGSFQLDEAGGVVDQEYYFKNVLELNEDNRGQRQERRKSLSEQQNKGVQVQQVK